MNGKKIILKTVELHEGEWTWWQISRAVEHNLRPFSMCSLQLLQELEEDGLIIVKETDNPAFPHYFVSEKGRKMIAS